MKFMTHSALIAAVSVMATVAFSTPGAADGAMVSAEQIEYKLFSKSKAISPKRKRSVDLSAVTFEFNSANLTPSARRQLDELGRVLAKPAYGDSRFIIGGHTDAVGGEDYNLNLSQRRADVVVDYLVSNYRLDRGNLRAVGYGESKLLAGQDPKAGSNRRAEVIKVR